MEFKIPQDENAQRNKMFLFFKYQMKKIIMLALLGFCCPSGLFHHFWGSLGRL